jgi:hypothetical protein
LQSVRQASVRKAVLALEREGNKIGLKINEIKMEYMFAAENDRTSCDVIERDFW